MRAQILWISIAFVVFTTCELLAQPEFPTNIEILDRQGNKLSSQLAFAHNGPILIDFWASYCKPCIIKYNSLKKVYHEWVEETNLKVYIVSIDDESRIEMAEKVMDNYNWPFDAYYDVNQELIKEINGQPGVPRSFLYDRKGNLLLSKQGVSVVPKDGSDTITAIQELYAGKKSLAEFDADLSEYYDVLHDEN